MEWNELICNMEGGSEAPGQVEDNKPGLQSRGLLEICGKENAHD